MNRDIDYNKLIDTLSYDDLINEEKRLEELYNKVFSSYKNIQNYESTREWRIILTKIIKVEEKIEKLGKLDYTPENIYRMAKEKGIKPTARYFDVYPSQIRYYVKKYENEN